jgi:outer membrane protein
LLTLFALPAAAQQFKLGYVSIDRIERDAKRPKRGAEMLRKEFAAREQATKEMQEKVLAMKAELEKLPPNTPAAQVDRQRRVFAERVQALEQARRTLVEDVDRRRGEERQKFFEEVAAAVQKIAEAQKFDLVLQQGVYASRAIDITDQVLKALDGAK